MKTVIPACDGSGRYLVEVEPDEVDGPDVLYIVETHEYIETPAPLTRRSRGPRLRRGAP